MASVIPINRERSASQAEPEPVLASATEWPLASQPMSSAAPAPTAEAVNGMSGA